MKYLTLFQLVIEHAYYPDQRCPDFQIEPDPETQKLLRDCRFVMKTFANGIQVLAPLDDQGKLFISLASNPLFTFSLFLQNSDFALFTDLTDFGQASAPLFTNSSPATSGDLALTSRQAWSSEPLIVQQPGVKETFILGGRPLENLKLADISVSGLNTKTGLKSYDAAKRVIAVNSSTTSPGTPFLVTYPVKPRLSRGVFADAEISFDANPAGLFGGDDTFRIVFTPREVRWKYYLVINKSNNKTQLLALEDGDQLIAFDPADQTNLTQTPDPTDVVALRLAEQYPDMQYYRFISSSLIPCRKAVRKNIHLQLNGEKIINSVPNPPLQNYSVELRNGTNEYSQYQLIKYLPHS